MVFFFNNILLIFFNSLSRKLEKGRGEKLFIREYKNLCGLFKKKSNIYIYIFFFSYVIWEIL